MKLKMGDYDHLTIKIIIMECVPSGYFKTKDTRHVVDKSLYSRGVLFHFTKMTR